MLIQRKQVHRPNLMSEVIRSDILESALNAIYQSRKKEGPHSDIWDPSFHWPTTKKILQTTPLSGRYQLTPLMVFRTKKGALSRFNSQDAVVLKALTLILTEEVKKYIGTECLHLKGQGGLKEGIRQLHQKLPQFKYVIKSDVADFYQSMDHNLVMTEVKRWVKEPRVLKLIEHYLNRCEVSQGKHTLITHGIPKGCPLSPLVGALILKSLDEHQREGVAYLRYMDDRVFLTRIKSMVRRLVKKMHHTMQTLQFKLAQDKTYIGRIAFGFEFCGYRFNDTGLIGLAKKTIHNFIEHILELYEHHAPNSRVQEYVRRWIGWCAGGLSALDGM